MQMNDSQRIPAPREKVWAALNDPLILKQCIPGCQSLDMSSPTERTATSVVPPPMSTIIEPVGSLTGR